MGPGAEVSEWKTDPFPHVVIDGMWSADTLRRAADEFPGPEDPRWITYPQPEEWGKRAGDQRMWGPAVSHAMGELKSDRTCTMLEQLTGLSGLTPDDLGGGMHLTCTGGRLDMHRDFSVHPDGRERKLNMLVFLNDEWEREWGGTLYLGRDRQVGVLPVFNRTVIFECGPESWHGHPEPVVSGQCRKSLACYWYGPPREGVPVHSTVWMEGSRG